MFKPKGYSQSDFELVSINKFVPEDHILRLIDKYIDFSFLLEKVRPFYSEDNGLPSDPLILFKNDVYWLYLRIRSERRLEREVKMNFASRLSLPQFVRT